MFQEEMSVLLRELRQRGAPDADDQDISTQLCRVLLEHPEIPEARVLSEIGILFVEGFETTGGCAGVSGCMGGSLCVCVAQETAAPVSGWAGVG